MTGLNDAGRRALRQAIRTLHHLAIRVSLFLDPLPELMPIARDLGADRVELYTQPYAAAVLTERASEVTERYAIATNAARKVELGVNAGHDLSLQNLADFLKRVGRLDEVSIGHALIADALELGIAEATRRYLAVRQA